MITVRSIFTTAIITILTVSISLGQKLKGKMLFGGNLNFSGYSDSGEASEIRDFSFAIRPNFGGFVSNSVAMGIMLEYAHESRKSEYDWTPTTFSNTDSKENLFGVSYFLRYYKLFGKKFGVILTGIVGGSGSIANSTRTTDTSDTKRKFRSQKMMGSFTPGFVYFVSPKFALETSFGSIGFSIQERIDKLDPDDSPSTQSSFIGDFGLTSLQFGFNYYFGKDKAKKPAEQ